MQQGEVIQARYELTELLGRGGMAEVWGATDTTLGRTVAIKFLAPQLSGDPEFLVRFFSEAQDVARISHPNVVRVLDFGEYEERSYLVMECLAGGSLSDKVGEPHEPEWAFELIRATAEAAGAAHTLGIVHRDIKPGNILLDEDGVPKLADFGIASSGRSERLTATGAAIGSPHYISPEQASGGNVSPASDVYALGIVLYELLAGTRPFEGDNVTAIAIAHVDQEPAPPSTHVPELSPAVDALVLRCLSKDPADRFSDGSELADALARFEDWQVGPGAFVEMEGDPRWWTNKRFVVAAALVAALMSIPAIALLTPGEDPATASINEEQEEGRLPNIGGLKIKQSASPDPLRGTSASSPRPSPSTKQEREQAAEREEEKQEDETVRPAPEEEDEPEPNPEPSQAEPTPQPSGSPAP